MKNAVLGAVCTANGTSFNVFAPYARTVSIRLYESDMSDGFLREIKAKSVGRGVFGAYVGENLNGYYYAYCVDGMETVDPYAKSCGANSRRGFIFEEGSADPDGWQEDEFCASQPIIWETHVRDFSSDPALGLPDKGKYSAFRSGVTLEDGKPVLIDYLKRLGVTYVQLLPVLDFGSVDELGDDYNWGYDPMLYFAPEGSYSSDPHDGYARVRELKQLVLNLHRAGIGVVLDVVYNHTYRKNSNPLDVCAPDYYYRMKDGKPLDGSGCGNETRSESAMFSRLMIDSVTYLAKEYHIDGFRFDLMGLHDVATMNKIRSALDNLYPDGRGKNILMYGEPWYWLPPHGIAGADKEHIGQLDERIGVFNDVVRDAIRGDNNLFGRGYVQGDLSKLDAIVCGVSGGACPSDKRIKIKSPTQQVLYAACHDNYTLFDRLTLTAAAGDDIVRMQKMAAFIIFSGIGIPFIQAGEEFLRTKNLDGNSYRSGDEINKLDWNRMSQEEDTVNYYRGLIAIRRRNKAFEELHAAKDSFRRINSPYGTFAYVIGGYLYVLNNTDQDIELPIEDKILQLADINVAGTEPIKCVENTLTVPAHDVFAGEICKG